MTCLQLIHPYLPWYLYVPCWYACQHAEKHCLPALQILQNINAACAVTWHLFVMVTVLVSEPLTTIWMLQVLSQVLVSPLVQEYVAVKKEWMKQKLWKQDDFIEVRDDSCSEEMKPKIIEALHTFLEM